MKRFCVALAFSALMASTSYADKPKGYSVNLPEARIGTSDFDRGEYKLLIHRDELKAEVQDIKTGDVLDVAGKVQVAEAKFERTEVTTSEVDGVKRIVEIRLGGTPFRIDFGNNSAQ